MFNSVWYKNLIKPPFAPPDWLFAPAWGILYITIILAFIIYCLKPAQNKKSGYIYFAVQLLLNILWTPVFFGLKNIFLGLFVIIILDIFVYLTIRDFYRVSKLAGILLIPYFVWILFATYLNIGYFLLN